MAARRVVEAQWAVAEQRERISGLKHDGHGMDVAEDLLDTLLLKLDVARRDYERAECGE